MRRPCARSAPRRQAGPAAPATPPRRHPRRKPRGARPPGGRHHPLPPARAKFGAARRRAGHGRRSRPAGSMRPGTDVRWQIELQPTVEDYLASVSPSTRKTARRTSSKLERTSATACRSRVLPRRLGSRRFPRRCRGRRLADVSAPLGCGLLAPRPAASAPEGVGRARLAPGLRPLPGRAAGGVRAGSAAAGCWFDSLAGAYDPDYGHHRVGAYLLLEAIEDLGAEQRLALRLRLRGRRVQEQARAPPFRGG